MRHRYLFLLTILVASMFVSRDAPARADEPDPIFDLKAIASEPLDSAVTKSSEKDGIVTELIEFTSRVVDGKPERISGIFMYPKGGKSLPGVLWCMGGMAAADGYFPGIYAKKGYAAIAITLRHDLRKSWDAFDAGDPKNANFTKLAIDQMRAVTFLAQRPEVDPNRLGVGGASYGGIFSTLVAGADPRIKAGMSYFAGGRHDLGTNLPQFTAMKSAADVDVWGKTIDPAWRLTKREVPFLWGIASNDNWFSFPAVTRTFADAIGAGKRMVIVPHWQHGFPPDIDDELNNFFDTNIGGTKPAYNQPGPIKLEKKDIGIVATWNWTGSRKITKAVLAVSYGPPVPWLAWQHRATLVLPATLVDGSASAVLPIPESQITGVVWGNITDDQNVTTSTEPLPFDGTALGASKIEKVMVNGFPNGDLSPEDLAFFTAQGFPLTGKPDKKVKQGGEQSLRIDPDPSGMKVPPVEVHVHHVPMHSHKATVWLRADKATKLRVFVAPFRDEHWKSGAVASIVAKDPLLKPLLAGFDVPLAPISPTVVEVGPDWKEVVLDVPWDGSAIDHYSIVISQPLPGQATWWYDSVKFETVWKK